MGAQSLVANGGTSAGRNADLARTEGPGDALVRVVRWCRLFPVALFAWILAWRLRPLLERFFFPSALSLRLGRGAGLDGLCLEVLNEQSVIETGAPLPSDLPLTILAAARARMLPRALARAEVRLLFEQHVVGPLHVLLAKGNYEIEAWVRSHHRDRLGGALVWMTRKVLRRHAERPDPVAVLRERPGAFSALIWNNLWALPELERLLTTCMPEADRGRVDDTDPLRIAVNTAIRLDTDHTDWDEPQRLLRDLHTDMAAASSLAPEHALVRQVARRVHHAARRLSDFDEAYDEATKLDPPPDWITQALEAIDSEHEVHGVDSAAALVRRIACRVWVNGSFPMPTTLETVARRAPRQPKPRNRDASPPDDDDDKTGF